MCIWYRSYECTADKEYKWKCSSQLWSNLSSYKIISPEKNLRLSWRLLLESQNFFWALMSEYFPHWKPNQVHSECYTVAPDTAVYTTTLLSSSTHMQCYLQHNDNNLSPCKILEKSINQRGVFILPFHESWQDQDLNNILTHSCCFCLWYGASHKVQDSLMRKEQPMNNITKMKTKLSNGNIEQAAPWKGGR